MPIETPGYSAQAALTAYTSLTEYMEAGFVYVHAGCRGRDAGAMAASFADYINQAGVKYPAASCRGIKFVTQQSCGVFDPRGSRQISAPARLLGSLPAGIKDENGNVLTLEESTDGVYQAGSYYDYIVGVIEESLNNFLSDTEFPYDSSASGGMDGGPGGMGGFEGPGENADFAGPKGDGNFGKFDGPDGIETGDREFRGKNGDVSYEERDNIFRTDTSNGIVISGTYETANDYIDALNANGTWVTYDAAANTGKTLENPHRHCAE